MDSVTQLRKLTGEDILKKDGWSEHTFTSVKEAYPDVELLELPEVWQNVAMRVFIKLHPEGPTGAGAKVAIKTQDDESGEWGWFIFLRCTDRDQFYLEMTQETDDEDRIARAAAYFRRPDAIEFPPIEYYREPEMA